VAEYDEAAERIEEWLRVRPIPRKERGLWKRLVKATEDFAFGPWAIPAIESGWSDCALFSQALGLVPEQLRRTLIIADIDASAATVMNGKGKLERFRRMNLDHPAWWNDPRFIPGEPAVEGEWQSTRGTRPRKVEAKAPKKQSRETQCGACLLHDKGRCLWHEQPLDPTMALCGGVHHHDK